MQRTSKRCLITYSHSLTITCILLIAVCLLGSGCAATATAPSQTYHPELEYLKALHQNSGAVQTVTTTAANVADINELPKLLREDDRVIFAEAGYSSDEYRWSPASGHALVCQ
jgi:hypothetical protein